MIIIFLIFLRDNLDIVKIGISTINVWDDSINTPSGVVKAWIKDTFYKPIFARLHTSNILDIPMKSANPSLTPVGSLANPPPFLRVLSAEMLCCLSVSDCFTSISANVTNKITFSWVMFGF